MITYGVIYAARFRKGFLSKIDYGYTFVKPYHPNKKLVRRLTGEFEWR